MKSPNRRLEVTFQNTYRSVPEIVELGNRFQGTNLQPRRRRELIPEKRVFCDSLPTLQAEVEHFNANRCNDSVILVRTQKQIKQYHSIDSTLPVETIHSAQGKQWATVFLNCSNLPLPHADPAHERRTFYVGFTRAKDRLFFLDDACPYVTEALHNKNRWNSAEIANLNPQTRLVSKLTSWIKRVRSSKQYGDTPKLEEAEQYLTRLVSRKIITSHPLKQVNNLDEFCDWLDIPRFWQPHKPDSLEKIWYRDLRERNLKQRRQDHMFRCISALERGIDKRQYMIFSTVTYANWNLERALQGKLNQDVNKWIARVYREIGISVYGSKKKWDAAGSPRLGDHYGQAEYGEDTGRLHVHMVWFFNDIPPSWKQDPNEGVARRNNKSIVAMNRHWTLGSVQTHEPMRTNRADKWSELGWIWPNDETGQRLKDQDHIGLGYYLSGYVTKSTAVMEEIPWRTKISRNFGMYHLDRILDRYSKEFRIQERIQELNTIPSTSRSYQRDDLVSGLLKDTATLTSLVKSQISMSSLKQACPSMKMVKRRFMQQVLRPNLSLTTAMRMYTLTPRSRRSALKSYLSTIGERTFSPQSFTESPSPKDVFSEVYRLERDLDLTSSVEVLDLLPRVYQ